MSEDQSKTPQNIDKSGNQQTHREKHAEAGKSLQFGDPAVEGPTDPSFPLANLPESTENVRLRAENHEDRRIMRKCLFRLTVGASALFLLLGAIMSVCLTRSMIETKKEVKEAMVKVVNESSPKAISEFILTAQPVPPESLHHARETARELSVQAARQRNSLIEKFLETTNWLSLSPMITLIAFILGVGLTLAIALMRALFREEESEEKNNVLAQISTPISKLFEYLVEYLQSKFKK
ncbi:TPA: hypothetical protein J1246_003045 [Escherichia coli]|nr:hypothetical protein [Escherichia coli]EGA3984452.1 hypothetical protein [Escherichia coli]ELD5690828.1 hypothetical protein [Escherichia coli]ELO5963101.1 hypothetical protein [Escherichia coli]MCN4958471.1 hypothetical protein [Escherichia coli]